VVKFTDGADARFSGGLQDCSRHARAVVADRDCWRRNRLHWPDLDADIYVPALLRGIYGNKLWMAKSGNVGFGKKRSEEESGAGERLKAAAAAEGSCGGD